jgi:hypothetical protein
MQDLLLLADHLANHDEASACVYMEGRKAWALGWLAHATAVSGGRSVGFNQLPMLIETARRLSALLRPQPGDHRSFRGCQTRSLSWVSTFWGTRPNAHDHLYPACVLLPLLALVPE